MIAIVCGVLLGIAASVAYSAEAGRIERPLSRVWEDADAQKL